MDAETFWSKVERTSYCWAWTGWRDRKGYGRTTLFLGGKRVQLAHRASYILVRGEIPGDVALDHLCRNTSCVNPEHLDPCGLTENSRRQRWKDSILVDGVPCCKRGHPLATSASQTARQKVCLPCAREYGMKWRAEHRAQLREYNREYARNHR